MKTKNRRQTIRIYVCMFVVCFISYSFTQAQTISNIKTGLHSTVGIDIDEPNNHLYFVEYTTNSLRKLDLNTSAVSIVATGLSHPEDVALDMAREIAYVTTRDHPGTGGLYRVDLKTGTPTLITFNLGAPQQISLDAANDLAYVVSYNDGRLRSINLSTGSKKVICTGLKNPVGLAVTRNQDFAYVTEQSSPAQISRIDLVTGTKTNVLATGLAAPFFLEWVDETEDALYLAERAPANKVSKIDLITNTKQEIFTGLVPSPSAMVKSGFGMHLYITTSNSIKKAEFVLDDNEPGLMGVGHIPISAISSHGYATTAPGYFYKVKNAPFGGTMNIFGNLTRMIDTGAVYYSVYVSKNGATAVPLTKSWVTYKWDASVSKYLPVTITPESGTTWYRIPTEYATSSARWYPPYLIMRYPSAENGIYVFSLKLYNSSGTDITGSGYQSMTLLVDNTPPEVKLHNIYQYNPAETNIETCDIVDSGNNSFKYQITAYDAEGHLYNYAIYALYGSNKTHSIFSDNYNNHSTSVLWNGVINQKVPATADAMTCNCAYSFYLYAWGRTTNGYYRTQYVKHHKSITINLPSLSPCF